MNIDKEAIGRYPNIAVEPGTPVAQVKSQADTREKLEADVDCVECAEALGRVLDARCDPLKERIAELEAERDRLKEQLENDDEPFCETVRRWLTHDVPEECIECEDGCWAELHGLLADECDTCEPANAMQAEINYLRKVVKAQADSFKAMEAALKLEKGINDEWSYRYQILLDERNELERECGALRDRLDEIAALAASLSEGDSA